MAATNIVSYATDPNTLSALARIATSLAEMSPATIARAWLVLSARQVLSLVVRRLAIVFIMSWIFIGLTPPALSQFGFNGLVEPTIILTKGFDSAFPNTSHHLLKVANWTKNGFSHFGLDNRICKRYMSCRAGEFVATEYPLLVSWMKSIGAVDKMRFLANNTHDSYIKMAVTALEGSKNVTCHEELEPCEAWISYETMFGITQPVPQSNIDEVETIDATSAPSNEKLVDTDETAPSNDVPASPAKPVTSSSTSSSISPSTSSSTTESPAPSTISPSTRDAVVNTIRRLAANGGSGILSLLT